MFSWFKYLIVSLFIFSTSVFGVGIFFLIAPFPDLCLLVSFFFFFFQKKFSILTVEKSLHILHGQVFVMNTLGLPI